MHVPEAVIVSNGCVLLILELSHAEGGDNSRNAHSLLWVTIVHQFIITLIIDLALLFFPRLYQSLSAPSRKARQSTASIAASTSALAIVFFLLDTVNDEDSAARLSTKSSVALEIRKTASCDAIFVSGSCFETRYVSKDFREKETGTDELIFSKTMQT